MHNDRRKIELIFTLSDEEPRPGCIHIRPKQENWNDFGYRINCHYSYRALDGSTFIEGGILLGFLAPEDSSGKEEEDFYEKRTSLIDLLKSAGEAFLQPEELPRFFTLLPALNDYRKVVAKLGVDGAARLFSAINDLVFYKNKRTEWITKALETTVFKRAFMRNSEPFYAFHNADSVLNGLDQEDFSAVSQSLNLSFQLDGFPNSHELELRFANSDLIPRRISVLIGKNGLGKSQALRNFCQSALRRKPKDSKLTDPASSGDRPMISRVLAIGTPGETRNTFPSERIRDQKLFYRRLNLTRGSKSATSRSIAEALVQLARNELLVGERHRWNLFLEALEKSLPVNSIVIGLLDGRFIPLKALTRGAEQETLDRWADLDPMKEPHVQLGEEAYPLSSGQLTFFKFALLSCLHVENGSIVLMDEPETHLHPNLISDFVDLLDYVLEQTGSLAILATHSAYFVREVPTEQVHVFHQDREGFIHIDHPRLKTFGAPVDSISQFVFGEDTETRLTEKVYRRVKGRDFASVDKELRDQLSLAALMDIKRRLEGDS